MILINLLIPIISNESTDKHNEFKILGGFLGYKTGEDAEIRILYIPISLWMEFIIFLME